MSEKIGAAPTGHPDDSATRRTHWRGAAAPLNVWQQAIDAELVSTHLGIAHNDATFEGAQKAIHDLLCWHIDVATNPATNGGQRLTDAKPIVWPVAMPEPVAAQVRFKPESDTTWSRWKVCALEDAREIEAYTLANCWNYEVRYLHAEQQVHALLATGGQAHVWEAPVRELLSHLDDVLPDDALDKIDTKTWGAVSRLVGIAANCLPQTDAGDEEREKLLRALYDRGYEDRAKERDYDPLGASEFDAAMCAGAARAKQADALDAELLNFLQDQSIDLRCFNSSDGEDVGWRTVQHHMSEPRERVVSEVYGDQPRRAIREAMARIERDPYCTGPLHLEDDAAIAAAKGE